MLKNTLKKTNSGCIIAGVVLIVVAAGILYGNSMNEIKHIRPVSLWFSFLIYSFSVVCMIAKGWIRRKDFNSEDVT